MKKRIAKLTKQENMWWNYAFEFWVNEGETDAQAERKTWKDMQELFPRLKKYDGCR